MTRTLTVVLLAAALVVTGCKDRSSTTRDTPAVDPSATQHTPESATPISAPREEPVKVTAPRVDSSGDSSIIAPTTSEIPLGMQTLQGVLKGDIMGIGGETTGWILVIENKINPPTPPTLDLDVSAVQADADRLKNAHVRATGDVVERKWPERGTVKQMKVTKLEEVK